VVGEKVFSHESGLHADGVIKYSGNYEGYDPAEVGLSRYLVVGKHSGSSGLRDRLGRLGICIGDAEVASLLERVRRMAQSSKGSLSDLDLAQLYSDSRKVA